MYSYSKIQAFLDCPLKYKYRYIDGIKPEGDFVEFFVGKKVHETLEKLYQTKEPSLEWLLGYYENKWYSGWNENILVKEGTPGDFFKKGRECLEHYYSDFFLTDLEETVATEKKLFFKINSRQFIGYIDRLSKNAGETIIHDYKTGGAEDTANGMQMPLYQIALSQNAENTENITLQWHFLSLKKRVKVKKTQEDLNTTINNVTSAINEIESKFATDFKPTKGEHCSRCDFKKNCPAWK